MIRLPKTVNYWGMPTFKEIFKVEMESIDAQFLPLQNGLSQGDSVSAKNFSVMILGASEEAEMLCVKAGIFYTSVLTGCHCADDPTPIDELTEYCEVQVEIQRETACAIVTLLA